MDPILARGLRLGLLGLLVPACGGAGPDALAPTEGDAVPAVTAGGAAAASTVPSTARPPCEGDPRCQVLSRTSAGTDSTGVPLFVIATSRGLRSLETGEPTDDPEERSCELHEHHLERAGRHELLLSLCNDGYGAAGVGEDAVTIEPNRLVHDQNGGSAWRWSTRTESQLAPRRLLRTSASGFWTLGTNEEERSFDLAAFRGRVRWYAPACGSPEADGEREGASGDTRSYLLLPMISLDPHFDPTATPISSCGTRVDGTEDASFLLEGDRGDADDAWLEILAPSEREILVFVHDDRFVEGADRLTVHVGPVSPSYMDHCLEPERERTSVVFDAARGEVLEGDPSLLDARGGRAPGGRFLHFTLPGASGGLTIAYTDADERGVERTFATSDLHEGDAHSLGAPPAAIGPEISCVIEGASLVRRVREVRVEPR